jgi:hypothetical protein
LKIPVFAVKPMNPKNIKYHWYNAENRFEANVSIGRFKPVFEEDCDNDEW